MKNKIKEEIESNLQNGNLQKSIDILNAYEQLKEKYDFVKIIHVGG